MTNYSSIVPVQRWGVLILAATVSLFASPQALASDDGDFEYWPKVSFLVPIDEQEDNSWHDTNIVGSYLCFLF